MKNLTTIVLATCTLSSYGCCANPSTRADGVQLTDETACFKDTHAVCYEPVLKRGRKYDAVFRSEGYKPFRRLFDNEKFDPEKSPEERLQEMWSSNPAWVMASLAHAAYLDTEELKAMLGLIGAATDDKYIFEKDNHQGYLAVFSDKAILVFRGTQPGEAEDIGVDLDLLTTKIKGVRVHRGFYKATKELWDAEKIEEKLDDAKGNLSDPSNIYVTGHSLGGALAIDSGFLYEFKEIVTFGQPRVAKDDLGPALRGMPKHKRYVNGNDKVPAVPLKRFGWSHHGVEVAIEDAGGPYPHPLPFPINLDHSPVNYAYVLFEQTASN